MELIGAAFGDDGDGGRTFVLGLRVVGLNLELLDGIDRRGGGELGAEGVSGSAVARVVDGDAVDRVKAAAPVEGAGEFRVRRRVRRVAGGDQDQPVEGASVEG